VLLVSARAIIPDLDQPSPFVVFRLGDMDRHVERLRGGNCGIDKLTLLRRASPEVVP